MINPINFAIQKPSNKNQVKFTGSFLHLIKKPQNVEKQELPEDLFFIPMKHYDKDEIWAKKMNESVSKISDMVNKKASFNKIINAAEKDVFMAYFDGEIPYGTRKGIDDKWKFFIEGNKKGEEYLEIYSKEFSKQDGYNKAIKPRANKEYKNANTCTIEEHFTKDYYYPKYYQSVINYPTPDGTNLKLAEKEYKKLLKTKNPDIDTVLKSTATIHWLLTQETPWKRGTASIANLITKSIMHSYNIQLSPIKDGKSFDFEAFYRDLDDFIEIYPDLFKTKPHIRKSTYA